MSAEIDERHEQDVDCERAKEALERLFADPRLKVTDRQKAILSYLVERRFDDEEVKAYAIAIDILGRPSTFDPAIDPIVRIEISRLRSSLQAYYAAFGEEHDIWISIRKGKYVACFTLRPVSVPVEQGRGARVADNEIALDRASSLGLRARKALLLSIILTVVGILGTYAYASRTTITQRPTVYVSVEAAVPQLAGEASKMRDGLLTALTQFQTVTVAQPDYASLRANGGNRRYSIQLKYYGDVGDRTVWWQVVENASGRMLISGIENAETPGQNVTEARSQIIAALARRIASNRGVINSIELQADPDSLGNGCVIRAEYALEAGGDLDAASGCLRRTLQLVPKDSDATAVLARVLLAPDGRSTDGETLEHALELARDAVARSPLSDRAQLALMAAQAANGRPQAAIEAGNRAVALNPNNPDAVAAMAGVLYSEGYRQAGVSMARDATKNTDVVPRCAMIVLALDAYRDGRYSEALVWTDQVNGGSPLTKLIQAAALGELGSAQARASLDNGKVSPALSKKTFNAVGLRPDIVAMLERGLSKAGFEPKPVGSISR